MIIKTRKYIFFLTLILIASALAWLAWQNSKTIVNQKFDGRRALKDVEAQVNFGPRLPGSLAHKNTIQYINSELEKANWQVTVLSQEINGHIGINILATRKMKGPTILIGAHYDSRLLADHDPILLNRSLPVPGANDGASGVAVLLEIARTLPVDAVPVSLLFIDIEDNGNLPGWDWIQGSKAFAASMQIRPEAVVILDMIGDADLNIFMEKNSDPTLTSQIWSVADSLGYKSSFIPEYKYQVLDDHLPFIEKGISAVDIIDLDYSFWHTTQDTTDKVSANSLQIVGDTILAWLDKDGPCILAGNCPPGNTP